MKRTKSSHGRKQKKWAAKAPAHQKRKMTSVHLSKELRAKYKRRSLPVRKGDRAKVLRGSNKAEGEVLKVLPSEDKVYIEGVTVKKRDGTDSLRPVKSSNLMLTHVDLSDKKRREVLERKVSKDMLEKEAVTDLKRKEEREKQAEAERKAKEKAEKAEKAAKEEAPAAPVKKEEISEKGIDKKVKKDWIKEEISEKGIDKKVKKDWIKGA